MTVPLTVHASTVAFQGRAVVIRGASGSGKSALALQLMSAGAQLVADDQTTLTLQDDQVMATCPPSLAGLIEARGVGILRAPAVAKAAVSLVVDLDDLEPARLPEWRETTLLGRRLALVLRVDSPHFPAAILHYVQFGRQG